jgi:hypothetical protein
MAPFNVAGYRKLLHRGNLPTSPHTTEKRAFRFYAQIPYDNLQGNFLPAHIYAAFIEQWGAHLDHFNSEVCEFF